MTILIPLGGKAPLGKAPRSWVHIEYRISGAANSSLRRVGALVCNDPNLRVLHFRMDLVRLAAWPASKQELSIAPASPAIRPLALGEEREPGFLPGSLLPC